MRTHTGDRTFACTTCSKAFSQSGNLVTHMRIHSGHRPYACTSCSKNVSQPTSLASHMRTHIGMGNTIEYGGMKKKDTLDCSLTRS